MIRSLLLACGLFLMMAGTFLFCVKQATLRYCPAWLQENKISGYFIKEVESERLLIVPQWIAIMIITTGTALFLYTLGSKRKSAKKKPESKSKEKTE